MDKWSACSPTFPMIQIHIPLMSTVFYSVNCLKRKAIHGCQFMDTFRSCLSSDSNWIPPSHNKKSRSRSALGSADSSTTSILRPGIRILSTTSMLFLIIWLTHFCLSSNYESIKKLKETFRPRLAQFKNVESFHWRLHLWEGEKIWWFGDIVPSSQMKNKSCSPCFLTHSAANGLARSDISPNDTQHKHPGLQIVWLHPF